MAFQVGYGSGFLGDGLLIVVEVFGHLQGIDESKFWMFAFMRLSRIPRGLNTNVPEGYIQLCCVAGLILRQLAVRSLICLVISLCWGIVNSTLCFDV